MAGISRLAVTLVTGVLLVGIVVGITRFRNWRGYPTGTGGHAETGGPTRSRYTPGGLGEAASDRLTDDGFARVIIGASVILAVGAVVVLAVAGLPLGSIQGGAGLLLGVAFLGLLGGYLVWGAYDLARTRGMSGAAAAGISGLAFGAALLVAVLLKLLLGG